MKIILQVVIAIEKRVEPFSISKLSQSTKGIVYFEPLQLLNR
jgi:hypothetical protein